MAKPGKIEDFVSALRSLGDRQERIEWLISIADRFREVPDEIAQRPFDRSFLVPHCESEAYFFPQDNPDGSLDLHFAVENPQGISARAMAVILDESLSGQPLEELALLEDDLPLEIFGQELSMGKTMGLNGMVAMVRLAARRRLRERQGGREGT
jgi:cysteine desulfuration protein SufE